MCCISHQATHLLFKYYISKLGGWGVKTVADLADKGGPRFGKTWLVLPCCPDLLMT